MATIKEIKALFDESKAENKLIFEKLEKQVTDLKGEIRKQNENFRLQLDNFEKKNPK